MDVYNHLVRNIMKLQQLTNFSQILRQKLRNQKFRRIKYFALQHQKEKFLMKRLHKRCSLQTECLPDNKYRVPGSW